jgi:esterase/lipase superfamily enzyme
MGQPFAQRRRGLRRTAPILALLAFGLAGCVTDKVSEVTSSVGDVFATGDPQAPLHIPMFVVSTRKGKDSDELADAVRQSLQTITVPPGHRPGQIERASFGKDNPNYHFTVAAFRGLEGAEFQSEIASHLSGRIGSNRDVLVYVHGFNTSYDEARFRLAQVVTDGRFGGVPVLFTWPASGSLFDYEAAKESASASRDQLAQTLMELADLPDVGRIHILAHSMGCWLTMEALHQDAVAGKPDLGGKLGDVMLAAPDIDVGVFRSQIAKLSTSHISVLVSSNDKALTLSRHLAGDRPRVGSLDPSSAGDRAVLDSLGVRVYDVSGESVGLVGHATFGDAPDVVKQIGATIGAKRLQDSDVAAVLGDRPVTEKVMTQPLPPMTGAAVPPPIAPAPSKVPVGAATDAPH